MQCCRGSYLALVGLNFITLYSVSRYFFDVSTELHALYWHPVAAQRNIYTQRPCPCPYPYPCPCLGPCRFHADTCFPHQHGVHPRTVSSLSSGTYWGVVLICTVLLYVCIKEKRFRDAGRSTTTQQRTTDESSCSNLTSLFGMRHSLAQGCIVVIDHWFARKGPCMMGAMVARLTPNGSSRLNGMAHLSFAKVHMVVTVFDAVCNCDRCFSDNCRGVAREHHETAPHWHARGDEWKRCE